MMKDFLNQEKDFPMLVTYCFDIMGALAGEPVNKNESWVTYAEGIGTKLVGHLVNMFSLFNSTHLKIEDKEIKFIDFASINILSRAAWETYLCFYFIFIDSKDFTEREFRFLIWDLAGYLERQGFTVTLEETKKIKEQEKNELNELTDKIKNHSYFKSLEESQKNKVLNSNWKFGKSVPELAEIAGFNKKYFGSIYSYLCGYSHNSRNSVMQVYQARSIEKQKELSLPEIGIATIILANFIKNYSLLHPKTKRLYEDNNFLKQCCNAWINIGQGMKT